MRILFSFLLLLLAPVAIASPSSVWWPAWTVSSSEELSGGIEYSKNSYTPSFPLSYLFDNNPKTAWVYSAKSKAFYAPFKTRYGIELRPAKPIFVDGLRLMNGQNASRKRFFGNERVVKIRVTTEVGKAKIVRTFSLSDKMGFHNISFARQKISSLMVEFIGLKSGNGDNDLCLSELQLTNHGQKINLQMPRAVMFYDGAEGCGSSILLLSHNAKVLEGIGNDMGFFDQWSQNERYVCGTSGNGGYPYLWIADAWRGKILRTIDSPNFIECKWQKNSRLQLTTYANGKVVKRVILSPPFFKP